MTRAARSNNGLAVVPVLSPSVVERTIRCVHKPAPFQRRSSPYRKRPRLRSVRRTVEYESTESAKRPSASPVPVCRTQPGVIGYQRTGPRYVAYDVTVLLSSSDRDPLCTDIIFDPSPWTGPSCPCVRVTSRSSQFGNDDNIIVVV